MKRLLCIIGNMNSGGAETFLMKIYRKLDREKYQMDFCVNVAEKNFYEDEITALGGRMFRIPAKSQNLKEFKRQLSELIQREKYEYVFRICSNAIGFMELKIAKKSGAKRCIVRSSNSSDGASLKMKLLHNVGKVLYDKYVDVKMEASFFGISVKQGNEVALSLLIALSESCGNYGKGI